MTQSLFSSITIPTWVTLSRLVAVPIILAVLTWQDSDTTRAIALVSFLVASLTDWLDGYLARKLNQVTELGKFLDPLVDKLLILAPLLLFVQLQQIPAWGVFAITARELLITAWRGAPSQQVVGANLWGKAKTVMQIAAVAALMVRLPGSMLLFWAAVVITVLSGLVYVLPTNAAPTSDR